MTDILSRRTAMRMLGAAAVTITAAARGSAAELPMVTVRKDPNCSCCTGWAEHVRAAGFPVTVVAASDLKDIRTRLGVPDDLAGCHTAEVGGYVVEGHVPADAIKRLLSLRPAAIGLAVPGMPAGSPGMGGTPEVFEVTLFGAGGRDVFGRYQGANRQS